MRPAVCTGTPCPARAFERPVNDASEIIRAMVGAPHRVKLRIRRSPEPASPFPPWLRLADRRKVPPRTPLSDALSARISHPASLPRSVAAVSRPVVLASTRTSLSSTLARTVAPCQMPSRLTTVADRPENGASPRRNRLAVSCTLKSGIVVPEFAPAARSLERGAQVQPADVDAAAPPRAVEAKVGGQVAQRHPQPTYRDHLGPDGIEPQRDVAFGQRVRNLDARPLDGEAFLVPLNQSRAGRAALARPRADHQRRHLDGSAVEIETSRRWCAAGLSPR